MRVRRANIHSILTKPSVRAFCPDSDPGMDDFGNDQPIPMMAIEPWQRQFDFQDGKFEDVYNPASPGFRARLTTHHLNQRQHIARMYFHHRGASREALNRHERRQNRIIGAYMAIAWNDVEFSPIEIPRLEQVAA